MWSLMKKPIDGKVYPVPENESCQQGRYQGIKLTALSKEFTDMMFKPGKSGNPKGRLAWD